MHLHHHENAMAQLRAEHEDFLRHYRQCIKMTAAAMAEKDRSLESKSARIDILEDELAELQAKCERMEALVKDAFYRGWDMCWESHIPSVNKVDDHWKDYQARTALTEMK